MFIIHSRLCAVCEIVYNNRVITVSLDETYALSPIHVCQSIQLLHDITSLQIVASNIVCVTEFGIRLSISEHWHIDCLFISLFMLEVGSTGDGWITLKMSQQSGKRFYVMTSSCSDPVFSIYMTNNYISNNYPVVSVYNDDLIAIYSYMCMSMESTSSLYIPQQYSISYGWVWNLVLKPYYIGHERHG